jgi:hypothetical protein
VRVVHPKMLDQVFARHHGTGFGKRKSLRGISGGTFGGDHHGQAKRILREKLDGFIT